MVIKEHLDQRALLYVQVSNNFPDKFYSLTREQKDQLDNVDLKETLVHRYCTQVQLTNFHSSHRVMLAQLVLKD